MAETLQHRLLSIILLEWLLTASNEVSQMDDMDRVIILLDHQVSGQEHCYSMGPARVLLPSLIALGLARQWILMRTSIVA
mmetsp:Transcript_24542/g.67958  ORF Transcript_24542/g.67958 Transcript_24542/m.67958 type:complete len:80 (-) Transcript_24542:530-769(-)